MITYFNESGGRILIGLKISALAGLDVTFKAKDFFCYKMCPAMINPAHNHQVVLEQ